MKASANEPQGGAFLSEYLLSNFCPLFPLQLDSAIDHLDFKTAA